MQSAPKVNILLIDDHPENLIALEAILEGLGQNLVKAYSGAEALRCLLHQDFAVILLDVQMPGMDGFETAMLIRQRERSRNTPIIFLTAFGVNDTMLFKGYTLGAVDYLSKPIDSVILKSKVTVFVELFKKTLEVKRQATELKSMNSELKESEEKFRALSACSPIAIFLTDTAGKFTYKNPNCQAFYNFQIDESWQEGWAKCIYAEDRDRVLADWSHSIRCGQTYSDEFRICRTDNTLCWVHVRTSVMFSDNRQLLGYVGTIEDITERKQAEIVREQMIREQAARQEAEAANRMKDEFLAIVSHELRTPLTSILGWSKQLLTRQFDPKTTNRALETIERNAQSQAQLIEDILDVSKIIRGKLQLQIEPVNLVTLIETLLETVRPQADAKAIQLESIFDPQVQMVCGDQQRLRQVIGNLLSNAIKFTSKAGRVEISLSMKIENGRQGDKKTWETSFPPRQSPQGREPAQGAGSSFHPPLFPSPPLSIPPSPTLPTYAQITVTDTGIGINPEFIPYVFDRFRQADSSSTRSYGGLGLGLTIARHLVELHNGKIYAHSEGEGKGATFTVELPLPKANQLKPESAVENNANAPENLPSLDNIQILVVEDNTDSRDFLKVVLEESNAKVTAVGSVSEAIECLKQEHFHVLVSDIGMPEEDGYQLISQVRDLEQKNGIKIPAIALTAYTRTEDKMQALQAGFQKHLAKPIEPDELVKIVAELVDRS
ncbi:PAS/PAC sensor hybrid histidine kinase [Tolypothrix sp. NIES-4075]|uniref:response regulator n=1 Tax=Tolypothrix sp. NIES-4075 TaxID=2005459 RepID=UPI000B5C5197|nr:response regulator [Tolypothrix sp. NIES-4075]GAX40972.1 PAS/PAC sensor hybrid histidine kinase [Tolypothrix sp. NIES-4075]